MSGISIIPKRNIVHESICNMFLAMSSDVCRLLDRTTSEPVEHTFGMIWQRIREFTVSQMANEKEI